MSEYIEKLILAVKEEAISIENFRLLKYVDVAKKCGITLGKNGESPFGFFWCEVRDAVLQILQREEIEIAAKQTIDKLATWAVAEGVDKEMAILLDSAKADAFQTSVSAEKAK